MMNNTLTFAQIRIDCPYPLQYVTDIKFTSCFNEHSRVYIKGVLEEGDPGGCIEESGIRDPIRLYEIGGDSGDAALFDGIVTGITIHRKAKVNYVEIEGMSHTYILDIKRKNRSFQRKDALYGDVMKQVVAGYEGAAFIRIPEDRPTGALLVQYRETDWAFLMRLASHFRTVLVPDALGDSPRFWVGLRHSAPKEIEYTQEPTRVDDREGYLHSRSYGFDVQETDFRKYDINSRTRLALGERVAFRRREWVVERTEAYMDKGLLQYRYRLGQEAGYLRELQANMELSGLSLLGQVLDRQNSSVKLHLRIDGQQDVETACWIPYAPQANNTFYCMPEIGTDMWLYFQNAGESSGIAINTIRRNGGSNAKTANPKLKYMGIPSGQEIKLGEMDMHLKAKEGVSITLDNRKGVLVESMEDIVIAAGGKLRFEAKGMFKATSASGGILIGAGRDAEKSQIYLESGARGGNANLYASGRIVNDGRLKRVLTDRLNEEIAYEVKPEKKFNFWEALGNVIATVVVVAVVAAIVVATAGTALVAAGAVCACAMPAFMGLTVGVASVFAVAKMADDWYNDTTSSFGDYLMAGAQGALVGAMIFAAPYVMPYVAAFLGPTLTTAVAAYGYVSLGKAFLDEGIYAYQCIKNGERWNPAGAIRLVGTTVLAFAIRVPTKEPIDTVTGVMFTRTTDFSLPGPIPFIWERTWYSDSRLVGQMGHGMRHCYEMGLDEYEEEKALVVYLGDGRQVQYPWLLVGEEYFSQQDKLLIKRERGNYTLFDPGTRLAHRLEPSPGGFMGHKLTEVADERGWRIRFSYDSKGYLSGITDSAGREMNVGTNATGQVTKIALGRETLIQYKYNDAQDLVLAADALGQAVKMQYRNHVMVQKTDKNGGTFQWNYERDMPGARVVETFGKGGTLQGKFIYHDKERYTEVVDCLGHTEYHYDERSLVTKIVYPDHTEIRRAYDERYDLTSEIDEEGRLTTYTYNEHGRRLSVARPGGAKTLYEYDEAGRMAKTTNPEGATRMWAYNKDGTVQQTTDEVGATTAYAYNEERMVETVANAKGDTVRLAYDKEGNISRITLPDGTSSAWDYDSRGNCLRATNPMGAVEEYGYDVLSRMVRAKLADGNEVELEYDGYEDVIRAKDRYTEARFGYTVLGSLKSRRQGGRYVRLAYDTEERLTSITNETGEIYLFERDAKGNITKETGFDKTMRTYERDQSGLLRKANRPEGRYSAYKRDKAGNVIRVEHSDRSWEQYGYDKNGLLIEAANKDTAVRFERNAAGQIVREWQDGHWVASEYDRLGKRVQVSSSLGAKVLTAHDAMGRATHMAAAQAGQPAWAARMGYNEWGQEIERLLAGGLVSRWQYDAAGRAEKHHVRIGDRDVRKRAYEWDVNSRLKAVTDGLAGVQTTYGYDEFSDLVWSCHGKFRDYLYRESDEAGNLYETRDRSDRIYGAGSRLEQSGIDLKEKRNIYQGGKGRLVTKGTAYAYDAEGNLAKMSEPNGDTWEYGYYGNGMLSKVTRPDGTEVTFTYDPLGRRIEKQAPEKTTRFLWDGNVPLHEWSDGELTTWVFDGGFVPMAKLTGEGNYSIISDYLGTPAEAYDADGKCVWSVELDIYGRVGEHTGDVDFIPFRYQGQYADAETGLYYNRFRYYDPSIGQYTQPDPIGLAGNNPTLYGYVHNPNAWIDVFGLMTGFQIHHIVPRSVWNQSSFLQNSGLGMNNTSNLTGLPMTPGGDLMNPNSSIHNGWNSAHSQYNADMLRKILELEKNINADAAKNNWDAGKIRQETQKGIQDLQSETEKDLKNGKIRCG